MDIIKSTITSLEELENGFRKLTLSNGTILVGMFTKLSVVAEVEEEDEDDEEPAPPKSGKSTKKSEIDIPEDWDEIDEMEEDEIIELIEQEGYDIDTEDLELADLKAAIAEELDIDLPKKQKKADKKAPAPKDDDDDLTWEEIKEMDEEELADIIEEEDLDIDPEDDDFEDDIEALQKAVAKALKIEIPKKKKK